MGSAGINVDYRNPTANPPAKALAGFDFARFVYNISAGSGSQDYSAAHRLYGPHIDDLLAHGVRPIVVLTHQTWGEERGFDWKRMTESDWERLSDGFIAAAVRVARLYAGNGLVYQVWNEQDSASVAAVGMPAHVYGALFRRVYQVIKATDSTARVITGGLVSGPGTGINYYNAAKIQLHDGIGVHMYGVGAGGLYAQFGTIEAQLGEWRKLGRALWLTEFGVTDRPNEPVEQVAQYARAFSAACAGKVEALCYFPWGVQHNGYPIEINGTLRQPIIDALTAGAGTVPEPIPVGPRTELMRVTGLVARLNVRLEPSTAYPVLAVIRNGDLIRPLLGTTGNDDDRWREIALPGGVRGWVHTTAAGRLRVEL